MKLLLQNANQIVTFCGNQQLKGKDMSKLTVYQNSSLLIENGVIAGIFSQYDKLPDGIKTIDCSGKTITPAFTDCHTHFVFGGYREEEFNMRLKGATYMEIMQKGGGIVSTVAATRSLSLDELYAQGYKRAVNAIKLGITTLEGKSGYGLDVDTELKQLEVMRKLDQQLPIDIIPTYMGAHATPKEFSCADEYVDFIVNVALDKIAESGLAQYCDVFCEQNVFDLAQSEKILTAAKQKNFKLKIHAEEITPLGGSILAARLNATSCEHLLHISDGGIKALSNSDTVAVLLPATAFSLKEPFAPARKLIDEGVAVALASDLNPGSCYTQSIPLIIALACMYMGMTVEEALCALTLNACAAVDLAHKKGTLEKGKIADVVIHDIPSYKFLSYNFATSNVSTVICNGKIIYDKGEFLCNCKI